MDHLDSFSSSGNDACAQYIAIIDMVGILGQSCHSTKTSSGLDSIATHHAAHGPGEGSTGGCMRGVLLVQQVGGREGSESFKTLEMYAIGMCT